MSDNPGVLEAIFIAAEAKPAVARTTVRAIARRGLEGDRYLVDASAQPAGSRDPDTDDLTLVEGEALDTLERDLGIGLRAGEHRRNLVTRGVDLNSFAGKRFRIGTVECAGMELCHPCAHLQRLTAPGILKAMAGRGGLRAAIVTSGDIAVGDAIELMDEPR